MQFSNTRVIHFALARDIDTHVSRGAGDPAEGVKDASDQTADGVDQLLRAVEGALFEEPVVAEGRLGF